MVLMAQYESYCLLEKSGLHPWKGLGIGCGVLIIYGSFLGLFSAQTGDSGSLLLFLSLLLHILAVLRKGITKGQIAHLSATFFVLLYVPFTVQFYMKLFHSFSVLDQPDYGILLVIWIIVVAKVTDMGGFLMGKCFGRTPMAPKISPGKTCEGLLGGLLFAVGISFLFVVSLRAYFPPGFTPLIAVTLAIPIALTAVVSDLVGSLFKRHAHVKDSGSFIPGLGGMLDLFDSLLLSAPVGYFLLTYLLVN